MAADGFVRLAVLPQQPLGRGVMSSARPAPDEARMAGRTKVGSRACAVTSPWAGRRPAFSTTSWH